MFIMTKNDQLSRLLLYNKNGEQTKSTCTNKHKTDAIKDTLVWDAKNID